MSLYLEVPADEAAQGELQGEQRTSIRRQQTPLTAVAAPCSLYVSASRPNVTSSIKPEVYNVAQRRQRRNEPRFRADRAKISSQDFVQIGPAVSEICSRKYRRTDRWVDRNIPHLPGRSNYTSALMNKSRDERLSGGFVDVGAVYEVGPTARCSERDVGNACSFDHSVDAKGQKIQKEI